MFVELNEFVNGNIVFRDDLKVLTKGRGNIFFSCKRCGHQLISNVDYVFNMKSDILYSGQLLEKDYDIQLKDYVIHLKDYSLFF